MEDVVRYLKRYKIFEKKTEEYLLGIVLGDGTTIRLTNNEWKIIKWILITISPKFSLLSSEKQILLLQEMRNPGMEILGNHFSNRCNQLLEKYHSNNDDYDQPLI